MVMNRKFYIIIALLALSFHLAGQSDRVKTVEVPDSASIISVDTAGNNISGTNVQEALEESNPTYNNHVWISASGGDNTTGRRGDPHRAYKDFWGAQDSIGGTNISFIDYQGVYESLNNTLIKTDTFSLISMYPNNYVVDFQHPVDFSTITAT